MNAKETLHQFIVSLIAEAPRALGDELRMVTGLLRSTTRSPALIRQAAQERAELHERYARVLRQLEARCEAEVLAQAATTARAREER